MCLSEWRVFGYLAGIKPKWIDMSTLEKRLEDPEYKAWVKCGLCLNYVKSGLEEFANERSKTVHNFVITEVQKTNSYNKVCPAAVKVRQCRGGWQIGCRDNCDEYVKQIEKFKNPRFSFKYHNWKNSNIQLWPTDAWEMMKVFMNEGQKPFQNKAQDSDLSAILNFIDHCHIPKVDIANPTNITKVRDARNETMHSTSMKMRIADFQMFTGSMIDLLEDGQVLCHKKEAIDAVLKIKEIQGADFCITKTSEFALLTAKTEQVLRETQLLYEEVDGLKAEYEDIKSLLDDKDNALRSLLQDETSEREAHLSQLEDQMQEKQQQIKELSSELASIKVLVCHDKDLYRKMDIRLKNTESALDKTNTEVKEVTQSHKLLQKEVDNIKKLLDMRQDVVQQQPEILETKTTEEQMCRLGGHITANSSTDETHKLQKLQRENDDLKKCIEDLKAYYAQSNEQKLNKELHSKNKMLKQENDVLRQELNKTLSDSSATDTRRELSREKINQLEHEVEIPKENVACQKLEMTESELQSFKDRNEILEKNNIYLAEENERLTVELNNFQQHVNQNSKMSITCILDEKRELSTEVEYYKEKAINLEMHYETLKQDKSEKDNILEYVTNENKTLKQDKSEIDNILEYVTNENETLKQDKSEIDNILVYVTNENKTLKQDKSEIDNILEYVTKENETLKQDKSEIDNILQYVTNENETLEIQVQKLSLENSDLQNDISISKKKLSKSYSELENTEIELLTERNLRKNLDSEQQDLKRIIEQINEEKQEINRKNSEKQHALECQIQTLEIENKDLKENISKINLELAKQKTEALDNYTHGQHFESCSIKFCDVGINPEDRFDTEFRGRQNPEDEALEIPEASEDSEDESSAGAICTSGIGKTAASRPVQTKSLEGFLRFKVDISEGKRDGARSWKPVTAVLHDCVLYVINEQMESKKRQYTSNRWFKQPISLYGDSVILVQSYKKKKNVFRVMTANASEFLFQVTDEREMEIWLEGLQQNIDLIKYDPAGAKMDNQNVMLDMKVVSSSIVDVRLKNDKDLPLISGCVFLSTGQLVLCDFNNNKIKLLSSDLKVEESLDLQERKPFDISAASSSAVVITLPRQRQLQFIELSPELGQGQFIQLDKQCWGVCVVGEEIYVTCYSFGRRDRDGEVRIYNTNGVVKRRLGAPPEPGSSYMFSWPDYLTVNACSGRIYVSDWGRDTLTCLSEDGSIIYQYSDPELRTPQGLYVDADDYVIVCDSHSNNLQMISPSGEKVSTLLSEKDGIMGPRSVAYRPTDGVLVIGCHDDNNLHVFKLSH